MKALSMLAVAGLAATAFAAPREQTVFTNVISDGALNAPENTVLNYSATGGYTIGKFVVSGQLTALNIETYALEARVLVTPPGGRPTFIVQPFTQATFSGSLNFLMEVPVAPGYDPAGDWSFRFYESFNDAGQDSQWDTITFVYDDEVPPPPPPPPATDLGTLTPNVPVVQQVPIGAGEIKWVRFALASDVSVAANKYFDAYASGGTAMAPNNDPELGIYTEYGALEDSDDDDGPGLRSQLTYGAGVRPGDPPTGTEAAGLDFDGRDGSLVAGVYYMAIGGFNMTFNATGFSVTSTSTYAGNVEVTLRTGRGVCKADYNGDNQVDFFDYLDFANDFSIGCDD
jgi:hypothetical protein